MTISAEGMDTAPELLIDAESVWHHKSIVDSNIALLDLHLRNLTRQREQLLRQRTILAKQAERLNSRKSHVARLPMESIAPFLRAVDVCNVSASSRLFHEKCKGDDNQLILSHLVTPDRDLTNFDHARALLNSIRVSTVETLFIDAKKQSGRLLMEALASLGGTHFTSLVSLRVSAAAQSGNFLECLFRFVGQLPPNQLKSLHLSGFLAIRHVANLTQNQTVSLERFQVDYFVNGHEREIISDYLPIMPNLRFLVYDVADVCDVPVELMIDRLQSIARKDLVTSIYLPHVQISGDSVKIKELIKIVKLFSNVEQMVIRFRHLPLSVSEIVSLRESFAKLPACCISDHFVVLQQKWCSWWPSLPEVWDRPDRITGLSVFREQIDFDSLGTSATREWLKLSNDQKELWSTTIASRVMELYLESVPRRHQTRFAPSGSVARASSV